MVTKSGRATANGTGLGTVIANSGSMVMNLPLPPLAWPPQPVGGVPAEASAFQARTAVRALVEAARTGGTGVVLTQVLSGGGGVGKSQLAASYAHEAIRGRKHLVVWVNASAPGAAIAAYAQAAERVQARGVTAKAEDVENDARMFLEWARITDRSWLVVLDDITDPDQMDDWWPVSKAETGWVLATTRRSDEILSGCGRALVEVGVFSADESAAYLSARLTGRWARLLDKHAGQLADELGHLPLALSHAAAYIRHKKVSCGAYLEKFQAIDSRLDTLMPAEFDVDNYGARHGRTVAVTLLLALDAAQIRESVGLARRALELAAVLDPAGHPESLWSTIAVREYLSAQGGTPSHGQHVPAGPRSSDAPVQAVNPEQARDAVLLLEKFGLLTHDPGAGARAVRIHALTARAACEAATAGQVARAARVAADALVEVWPERDTEPALSQALRDCTASVRLHGGQILWASDAHPVIFRCGYSVGNVGLARQAAAYWGSVVAISSENLGPSHPTTLRARLNLAAWRGTAVDTQDRVRALEELLADCQRWRPDDPVTLETRVELARWRGEAGDSKAAVQALEELLAERSRTLGSDDPQTLHARHELAYWVGYDGKPARSIQMFEELVPDAQRVLRPDDPEVLQIRADLAFRQGEAGDPVTATHTFEELVPAAVRTHGARHLTTLNYRGNLARWHGDAGDATGAVQAFEQLLADSTEILGPDHQHVLNTRSDLAYYTGRAGDAPGAVRVLEELVPEYERVLGPDHWETHVNRDRLAHWRGMAGDLAGAVRAYEELLADNMLRVHGPDHDIIEKTRAKLADWRRRASGQSRNAH
jgi:tetratricopeptide (TPR) repeat protein